MVLNHDTALKTASLLLQIKAIRLDTQNLFTWASGIKSPIYCDNRSTLSFPEIRNFIALELTKVIQQEFSNCQAVVGVATGGIPHGTLVADRLNLPFAYVRSSAKEHGLGNMIEGRIDPGTSVVVVEDLVSTGKSSLQAVQALRSAGYKVLGMVAIFEYGFKKAFESFQAESCNLFTLSNYDVLIEQARKEQYIQEESLTVLKDWKLSN